MSILIKGMEIPKYTTKAEFGVDADGNPHCMVYHDDDTEPDIYDVFFPAIILDAIKAIPAADVVEVRHGRWIPGKEVAREYYGDCPVRIFYDKWTCSECGYVIDDHKYSAINYKFCPNCGADMREKINV